MLDIYKRIYIYALIYRKFQSENENTSFSIVSVSIVKQIKVTFQRPDTRQYLLINLD